MQGRVAPSGGPVGHGPWAQLHLRSEVPLPPAVGEGRMLPIWLTAHPVASSFSRELKYRAGLQAGEPSFQIRDYVESQKQRPGCCSFL